MNKFKNLFLMGLVVASTATMTSCTKDDEATVKKPTVALITPSTKTVSVVQGSTVAVEVLSAAGDAKLKSFRVEFSQGGGPFASYSGAFPNGNSDTTFSENNYTYKKTLPTMSGQGVIVYRFYATDKDNYSSSVDLTINVTADSTQSINSYSAKIMGAQQNNTLGSFLATTTGTVYKQADAKTNSTLVDVVYFYGATNKATLAAPDDAGAGATFTNPSTGLQTWAKRNATRFDKTNLTEANFNSVNNNATLIAFYLTNPTSTASNDLAAGQVLKFRTESGKRGFILVKSVTTGDAGSINVDVKVEK